MFVLYYVYEVLLEFYCSVFSREVCRVQDKPSCKSPCLFVPYGFTHYTHSSRRTQEAKTDPIAPNVPIFLPSLLHVRLTRRMSSMYSMCTRMEKRYNLSPDVHPIPYSIVSLSNNMQSPHTHGLQTSERHYP